MERGKLPQHRMPFVTTVEQIDRLDRWRGRQLPIPSRMEAIRQLIDYALEMKAREGDDGSAAP